MRILVIGSGGREHALCWKLTREAEVHCAPGNPGIAEVAECHAVNASDADGVLGLCRRLLPDLAVVGPENPLFDGLADAVRGAGFPVFGPGANGARLEGSKAFAKELMRRARVPTAASVTVQDPNDALAAVNKFLYSGPVVIKASGLAFGKGVVICQSEKAAHEAVRRMMVEGELGESGRTLVLEEFLEGREFSLLTLVSGTSYWSLPVAQDYKRIFDGDEGPNTGGMGSYSPVEWLDSSSIRKTEEVVVDPILSEMKARGLEYRGVLFSGLMANDDDVRCLEFNVRFGDPETQSILPRLGDGFAQALLACARGEPVRPLGVGPDAAVTVVLASEGYPGPIVSGRTIEIDEGLTSDCLLFHAGTAQVDGKLLTSGGRVMAVTATGSTVAKAREKAYRGATGVRFEGMQFRRDIALELGSGARV